VAREARRYLYKTVRNGAALRCDKDRRCQQHTITLNHLQALSHRGKHPLSKIHAWLRMVTAIEHDAAIVFAPRPFVLAILTRGFNKPADAAVLIAEITRRLYAASQPP
jgi:hypothetical protein